MSYGEMPVTFTPEQLEALGLSPSDVAPEQIVTAEEQQAMYDYNISAETIDYSYGESPVTYTPEQQEALGITPPAEQQVTPEEQAQLYDITPPEPEYETGTRPDDGTSTELRQDIPGGGSIPSTANLSTQEIQRVESVPVSAGAYIPSEVLATGNITEVVNSLINASAPIATIQMYLQGQNATWANIDYNTPAGQAIAAQIPAINAQIDAYNTLKGEAQFNKSIELGFIPNGSTYIPLDNGKWAYLSPIVAKEAQINQEKLTNQIEALNLLADYRLADGTYDLAGALRGKEGIINLSALLDAGFTKSQLDTAMAVNKEYEKQLAIYNLQKTAVEGEGVSWIKDLPKDIPSFINGYYEHKGWEQYVPSDIGAESGSIKFYSKSEAEKLVTEQERYNEAISQYQLMYGANQLAKEVAVETGGYVHPWIRALATDKGWEGLSTGEKIAGGIETAFIVAVTAKSLYDAVKSASNVASAVPQVKSADIVPEKIELGSLTPDYTSPDVVLSGGERVTVGQGSIDIMPNLLDDQIKITYNFPTDTYNSTEAIQALKDLPQYNIYNVVKDGTGLRNSLFQVPLPLVETPPDISGAFATVQPVANLWNPFGGGIATLPQIGTTAGLTGSATAAKVSTLTMTFEQYAKLVDLGLAPAIGNTPIRIPSTVVTVDPSPIIPTKPAIPVSPDMPTIAPVIQPIPISPNQPSVIPVPKIIPATEPSIPEPVPVKAVEPVVTPVPVNAPAPIPVVSPFPTPVPTPTPVPSPFPVVPPTIPVPQQIPGKPPLVPKGGLPRLHTESTGWQDRKTTDLNPGGMITWHMRNVWYVIKYPYKHKEDVLMLRVPPKGAIVASGAGSAYKTIQLLTGTPPTALFLDAGIMDIAIRQRPTDNKLVISFKKDKYQETTQQISLKGIRL